MTWSFLVTFGEYILNYCGDSHDVYDKSIEMLLGDIFDAMVVTTFDSSFTLVN